MTKLLDRPPVTLKSRSGSRPASPETDRSHPSPAAGQLMHLPVDAIDAHPDNPRGDWNAQDLQSLAKSVRQLGVVQPIVVRPAPGRPERFQLVAGERRLRAVRLAKHNTIPALVRQLSEAEALAVLLAENLQRKNLNPLEKAKLLAKLCAPTADGGAGYNHPQAAKLFGKTASWVCNLLRLLKLPDPWKQKLAAGELCGKQAVALLSHVDRPTVLAAVERDMQANPWAWQTAASFERSLSLVAANPAIAGRAPAATTTSRAPRAPQAGAIKPAPAGRPGGASNAVRTEAHTPPPAAAGEFPALANPAIRGALRAGCDADAAAFLVARITEPAHLDCVQAAIDRQRKRLASRNDK
jgi:ParB family chromosome partitioning protein